MEVYFNVLIQRMGLVLERDLSSLTWVRSAWGGWEQGEKQVFPPRHREAGSSWEYVMCDALGKAA